MRILKHGGKYLENKAKLNRNTSIPLLIISFGGLLYSFLSLNFSLIYLFIIILIIGDLFFKNYSNYKGGLEAENLVTRSLYSLSNDYYLINDIKLKDSYGNIDHIVLGPNGIFVIETKNYSGQIICKGDEWIRHYEGGLKTSMRRRPYWVSDRDYDIGSPSKQAKRNAVKIKQIVESSKIFKKSIKIWVEGIVVFTNPNVDLQLTNTTVPVLTIDELYDYIINKKSKIKFSSRELESIGKLILRLAEAD
ncbi:MAG: hypothetical protein DRP10_02525 [Candidatus Aenigmatarchaeota archaeon]|nr:MAG: hypothetical protein DRP10_02525 [Candidatus Aenigmarchaeota archaeon]